MRQRWLWVALCGVVFLAGCGSPQSKLESKADDCKKAFESRDKVKTFFVESEKHWVKNEQFSVKSSYDVRKTDSVVMPFTGKIEIAELWGFVTAQSKEAVDNLPVVADIDGRTKIIGINFIYKDGAWVFKSGYQRSIKVTSPDTGTMPIEISEKEFRDNKTMSKCLF